MERKGITIGGIIVFDYIKIVDTYPKVGRLANILNIEYSVGGAVSNTLIDLAKMDKSLSLQAIVVVGNDELGDYVLKVLKENNINTEMVFQQNEVGTSFTDDMIVESTERTFFHYRGNSYLILLILTLIESTLKYYMLISFIIRETRLIRSRLWNCFGKNASNDSTKRNKNILGLGK